MSHKEAHYDIAHSLTRLEELTEDLVRKVEQHDLELSYLITVLKNHKCALCTHDTVLKIHSNVLRCRQ